MVTPRVRQVFGTTAAFAAISKTLAANQGPYDGFLAAGLFWDVLAGGNGRDVLAFSPICVVIAWVYGGMAVPKQIFSCRKCQPAL